MPAAELRRGIRRRLTQVALLFAAQLAILLAAAGDPAWLWAWVYLALYVAGATLNTAALLRRSPTTLAERGRAAGMQAWEKRIGGAWALAYFLALPTVAGLDARFGWSPPLALSAHLAGALLVVAGGALVSWAMLENAFFATVARLQPERGQTVCSSGPYRRVRHPGYLGAVLQGLAAPLLLGSLWALVPGVAAAALMALRTAFEDRMLQRGLAGYPAYAARVRWRLLPGVW